jgi:hypothetical protein
MVRGVVWQNTKENVDMKTYPFLVSEDASGQRLQPIESKKKVYDEAWLQELLRTQPDVLPVREIEPIFHPMIPIGREVATETGIIDNLFISHRGYLTLVETKLWRNPEAKREVVAQAIDYGSSLAKWNYDRLNNVAREYTGKYTSAQLDLVDWVEKQLGPVEGGRYFFEETVAKNLRLGRFLTLIVGDRIRRSVIEMISYVNKYPALALDIALVELWCYQIKRGQSWPLLVMPHVVTRTEIVERSVIQVTVTEGKAPEIDVRQERAKANDKRQPRVSLTEEAFWELFRNRAPSQYDAVWNLVDEFSRQDGIEIVPRESSIVIALRPPEADRLVSLFFVSTNAYLHVWPRTLGGQLAAAGYDPALVETYDRRLRDILKMPEHRVELACPIAGVDLERFKSSVRELVRGIRLSEINQ